MKKISNLLMVTFTVLLMVSLVIITDNTIVSNYNNIIILVYIAILSITIVSKSFINKKENVQINYTENYYQYNNLQDNIRFDQKRRYTYSVIDYNIITSEESTSEELIEEVPDNIINIEEYKIDHPKVEEKQKDTIDVKGTKCKILNLVSSGPKFKSDVLSYLNKISDVEDTSEFLETNPQVLKFIFN